MPDRFRGAVAKQNHFAAAPFEGDGKTAETERNEQNEWYAQKERTERNGQNERVAWNEQNGQNERVAWNERNGQNERVAWNEQTGQTEQKHGFFMSFLQSGYFAAPSFLDGKGRNYV